PILASRCGICANPGTCSKSASTAHLIGRPHFADKERLGAALVLERRISSHWQTGPRQRPALHHEFLADDDRLILLARLVKGHRGSVERAASRPHRQQSAPGPIVAEPQT